MAAGRRSPRGTHPAREVVGALLSRRLVAEHVTGSMAKSDPALNTFLRNDDEGHAVLLRIIEGGLAAIGVEPEDAPKDGDTAPAGAEEAPSPDTATDTPTGGGPAPRRKVPEGTKQAQLIARAALSRFPARPSAAARFRACLGPSPNRAGRAREFILPLWTSPSAAPSRAPARAAR